MSTRRGKDLSMREDKPPGHKKRPAHKEPAGWFLVELESQCAEDAADETQDCACVVLTGVIPVGGSVCEPFENLRHVFVLL